MCNTDTFLDLIKQSDFDIEEALQGFWDASPENFNSKIFSPLHSQMQLELGSTYVNNYGMVVNSGNEHNGMQNQYGTNDVEFWNNILVESDQISVDDSGYKADSFAQTSVPEARVKEIEYSSESDGEVMQVQVHYYSTKAQNTHLKRLF